MKITWQDTKRFLRPQIISLSGMDDMLGMRFVLFLPWPHSYFSISPGRVFAVNEMKVLLAHMVVTYDIKFEEGKQTPQCLCIGSGRFPGKTNAMFRTRQK